MGARVAAITFFLGGFLSFMRVKLTRSSILM